jgi:hypothetical protein
LTIDVGLLPFFASTKNWSPCDAINNPAEYQQHIIASLKNVKITSYVDAAIATVKDPTKILSY